MASQHTMESGTMVSRSVAVPGRIKQEILTSLQFHLLAIESGRAEPCLKCVELLAASEQHVMMHVRGVEATILTSQKQESQQSVDNSVPAPFDLESSTECEACSGSGRLVFTGASDNMDVYAEPCDDCAGTGYTEGVVP